MSRSGYDYDGDYDQWKSIMWRANVDRAIRGRRGQAFLREMLAALDAIPTKRLIDRDLERLDGVCALGAVGRLRGTDMSGIDLEQYPEYEVPHVVANTFGITGVLAAEIMYVNDEWGGYWRTETPEQRWDRVRRWVAEQIR
jgi:hypothetical protein